jgi:hypothetical protein
VPQPRKPRGEAQGILYSGLFGGSLAVVALVVIAVAFLLDDDPVPAAVYGLAAPLFIPAAVVSVVDSQRRNFVLRVSTVLCMVIAIGSAVTLTDIGVPIIMSLPTLLLAQAAGLIFQRG